MANTSGEQWAEQLTDSVTVTDDEIQRIIDENSPGVMDVLQAFEDAEIAYGAATTPVPQVTFGSFTTAL